MARRQLGHDHAKLFRAAPVFDLDDPSELRRATLLHGSVLAARASVLGVNGSPVYNRKHSVVPFKHHAGHRHHISKPRYRVMNWAEYDAALKRRRVGAWVGDKPSLHFACQAIMRAAVKVRWNDCRIAARCPSVRKLHAVQVQQEPPSQDPNGPVSGNELAGIRCRVGAAGKPHGVNYRRSRGGMACPRYWRAGWSASLFGDCHRDLSCASLGIPSTAASDRGHAAMDRRRARG